MLGVICGNAIEENGQGDVSFDWEMVRDLEWVHYTLSVLKDDCECVVAATTCAYVRRLPASIGRNGVPASNKRLAA